MSCRQIERMLSYRQDGVLAPRQARAVEAHLARCPACAERAAAFRSLGSALRERSESEPPFDLLAPALARWRQEEGAARLRRRSQPLRPVSAYTAAAAALLVLSAFALARFAGVARPPSDSQVRSPVYPNRTVARGPVSARNLPPVLHKRSPRANHPIAPAVPPANVSVQDKSARQRSRSFALLPARTVHPAQPADDLHYINSPASALLTNWAYLPQDEASRIQARVDRQVHSPDDFVSVPFPRLASTAPKALAAAATAYQKEKEIVDARLSRNVTLAVKDLALSDLCRQLTEKTGVELKADRSVADEKVTVFCEERPLRDLMRQINHLLGFNWARLGEEGSYRYELSQDLRGRLTEEEMRNRDLHEALIALDEKMQELLKNKKLPPEGYWGGDWMAAQAYGLLSPADRAALINGEHIELSMNSDNPDRRLPPDLRVPMLRASNLYVGTFGGHPAIFPGKGSDDMKSLADFPDARPTVGLSISHSEAGELSLVLSEGAGVGPPDTPTMTAGFGVGPPIATGTSPAVAKPDNARLQEALQNSPEFKRTISLKPASSCPHYAPNTRPDEDRAAEMEYGYEYAGMQVKGDGPHVFASDVWEALYRATGMPVVADSYSRFYSTPKVTIENATLFDALCRAADAMGVHWKKDGDFLECRSVSFVWDKLKEVPNRLLDRWAAHNRRNEGLPLDDVLEMAMLSDTQLDSKVVGKVIQHCRGLREWGIFGRGYFRAGRSSPASVRPIVRFVAGLSPAQRRQALEEEGLPLTALGPAQQEALARIMPRALNPQEAAGAKLHVDYVPAGPYTRWETIVSPTQPGAVEAALRWQLIVYKDRAEALAAARRLDPNVEDRDIVRSQGDIFVALLLPDGKLISLISRPVVQGERIRR